jgi:hypothetical protein
MLCPKGPRRSRSSQRCDYAAIRSRDGGELGVAEVQVAQPPRDSTHAAREAHSVEQAGLDCRLGSNCCHPPASLLDCLQRPHPAAGSFESRTTAIGEHLSLPVAKTMLTEYKPTIQTLSAPRRSRGMKEAGISWRNIAISLTHPMTRTKNCIRGDQTRQPIPILGSQHHRHPVP